MQKQTITILSAELSGFQSLAERLTSEEITPLMGDVHALVENTVRLHREKTQEPPRTFLRLFRNR